MVSQQHIDFGVEPEAPQDAAITAYDQRHFLTYARLLSADTAGQDWRDGAATILGCDVEKDPDGALRCWNSHMARARWVSTTGYEGLLRDAGLISEDA